MDPTKLSKASRRRKLLIIFLIAVILSIFEISANYPNVATPLERLELSARDTAFRLRGVKAPNAEIVIVALDDESLAWSNERWPWSRSTLAGIVNWLNDAGAKVIAYDIFLFDPSPNPADDQALAEAFRNANAVVTVSQIITTPYSVTLDQPEAVFLPEIDGYGITEIERDDDAIVRSVSAYKDFNGEIIYNWSFKIVQAYLGIDPPGSPSLGSVAFNGGSVPLNQRGQLLVDFAGPANTYPYYSAAFVPLGDYPADIFRDKIVFIGATSETLQDLYPTPFSAKHLTPGVEVVANTVATLLSGNYLTISPPWVTLVLLLVMAVFSWVLIQVPQPTLSNGLMFGLVAVFFIVRQAIFYRTGLQLAIVSPSLMVFLGVIIPTLEQAVTQEVEKRRVRSLFSRFISPEMVNQLLQTQDINSLNKRTELTILFSDIRGFTTISEKMSPEGVVALLNPYLKVMSAIIHKHGGTVDKYEGDAIVAFFGEPIPHKDHAARAARAALEMRQALHQLNLSWQAQGIYTDIFEMGIGLNTGEVFVGLVGSEERINYTVIGDTANLAARLQDQTKEIGFPILISGETYAHIHRQFNTEYAGSPTLKGKSEVVKMYKLLSEK